MAAAAVPVAVVMTFPVVMVVFVFMVMLIFFMLVMVVLVFMLFMLMTVLVSFFVILFQFLYPLGTGRDLLEIKDAGIQYLVKVYVSIIAWDYFCLGLQGVQDLGDAPQFVFAYLVGLV